MSKKLNTELWIQRAVAIHKDKYDYSKVNYTTCSEKVVIICPTHGEFWQIPSNHLSDRGCPQCGRLRTDSARCKSVDSFIKECNIIHNNKYDYALVSYKVRKDKIKIICPIHGEFLQIASDHLKGSGCPKCKGDKIVQTQSLPWECIKERCNKVHKNLYIYPDQNYISTSHKIKIICKKHGEFEQSTGNHLQGSGCPICKSSKGEKLIFNWLQEHNILHKREVEVILHKLVRNSNAVLIDFIIEYNNKQYFIEYDGKQHFEYIPFFHRGGIINLDEQQHRDETLVEFCELNEDKITLLRFNYLQTEEEILLILDNTFKNNMPSNPA